MGNLGEKSTCLGTYIFVIIEIKQNLLFFLKWEFLFFSGLKIQMIISDSFKLPFLKPQFQKTEFWILTRNHQEKDYFWDQ